MKKSKRIVLLVLADCFRGRVPYTPFDVGNSAQKVAWDLREQGILEYIRLNSSRLGNFNQLDIRVDKKYFFEK
ncbi:MAG: hypothetical protein ACK4K0_10770 [Flavobacteriales bacterium]